MSRRRALGPEPVEGTQADTEVTTAPPSIMHSHQPHQQHASANTADGTRFLVQKSLWNQREPDELEKSKLFHLEREVRWVAPWLLQPNSDVLPHVSSFLVEDQTLDENMLLLSEVWCILVLGLLVRRFPKLANQQLVPDTIVTASCRTIRVVQGWVDGEAGAIRINKTPLIQLGKGEPFTDPQIRPVMINILR
ncbi:hypothetical protein F4824DRAFT_498415 [Ustulina deusta]|nr:hypothetical protein F4824DRAFT_498415 [Ustulina deusta]